ncbi:MarR family winged helix-turn-helix transcriptional regulator [Actinocorallia herbida]|uniref:MarR family winged helix-turn-helix transcriptional regulator n=1 Tax=Actinocorallia herbida TaxID=58109 RepID=UPI001476D0AC|nr:helix-turn-helix domain-containing protein [Actinocorallia herbida]
MLRTQARLLTATADFGAGEGLTGAQLLVLTAVVRGDRPPTVPQIARSLGHSRQAVQRLADALVEIGMVEAVDNPDHKRARLLVPTERGRAAYAAADAVSRTWAAEVTAGLDPAALAAATATLREIRTRLETGTTPR